MASALEQIVADTQQNDYASLVVLTAVVYDYALTFSDDIEYIWSKTWTSVSTLFILARYFGLCAVVTNCILGSSFLPGPTKLYVLEIYSVSTSYNFKTSVFWNSCNIIFILNKWATCIFLAAAELVMILRLWALYNQSRLILAVLLPFYVIEVVSLLVGSIITSTQSSSLGTVVQALDVSFCVQTVMSMRLLDVIPIAQLILCSLMSLFIAFRFVKESLQTWHVTQPFQPGRYMHLLAREGLLYFLGTLTLAVIGALSIFSTSVNIWWIVPQYVPVFTLVPRFVINLRELYARDVQGRRGSGLDSAFGLSFADHGAVGSVIVFADAEQKEEAEQGELIVVDEGEA